ncbi:MAG TPA: DUF2090 domain-containing protein [Verrucomicrobiales bacterium]|nr:DUF2090 domain-containing protein [Verrucomicrobiales bacterium]
MKQITLGKWRRLQQAANSSSTFSILAIDHRGPLRRALDDQDGPGSGTDENLSSLKIDVVRRLSPFSSAVLLDPETGVSPCLSEGALDGATGLLIALDTGSPGDAAVLSTDLVKDWTVERILRTGGAGVKLLIYWHPDAPNASQVEAQIAAVGAACSEFEVPFFLEPLSYNPESPQTPLPSAERRQVVIQAAEKLVPLGADILKSEFPINASEVKDEAIWKEACEELNATSSVPWVILSAGVSYEVFHRQTEIACGAGASGIMVGRAVWKEAATLDLEKRNGFLSDTAAQRMDSLQSICRSSGHPFTDILKL